eukprot:1807360-Rhodomonas_salina.4
MNVTLDIFSSSGCVNDSFPTAPHSGYAMGMPQYGRGGVEEGDGAGNHSTIDSRDGGGGGYVELTVDFGGQVLVPEPEKAKTKDVSERDEAEVMPMTTLRDKASVGLGERERTGAS